MPVLPQSRGTPGGGTSHICPLRALCAALLFALAGCGGGGGSEADRPASVAPERRPEAAVLLDGNLTETPIQVRVAQGADGVGIVVWRAADGVRHNLWASRSRADGTWGEPVRVETSDNDITLAFDVWIDAEGTASVLWYELYTGYHFARLPAGAADWSSAQPATPVSFQGTGTEVAYNVRAEDTGNREYGGYFDPVAGTVSGVLIESREGTGDIESGPTEVDGRGNAMGIYAPTRVGAEFLIGNYYASSMGGWERLKDDETLLGGIPGSGSFSGAYNVNVQLARSVDGDFLAAWQVINDDNTQGAIHVAHFTPPGRTWSGGGPAVADTPALDLRFQRLASSRDGQTRLLTWTQHDGERTALKAQRLFREGDTCEAPRTLDAAVGGGAAHADVAVDPNGDAVAVWQQFEGGRVDDGSRTNIAFARYDARTRTWRPAAFAETEPGNAAKARVSANGGLALLAWLQAEGGAVRVKVLRQALREAPTP